MSPEHNLLLNLFSIFVWAKVSAELFEHIRLPAVLGEILAGIVLGAHGFGLVQTNEATLAVAELGAVFLLFSVGLETKAQDLLHVGRESATVALVGVLLPFFLGLGYMIATKHETLEAIFVAAAMVATSIGITARILSDLGVLASRAARIILGAAVFDDILGMLVLAIVAGVAAVGHLRLLSLTVLAVEATVFVAFMILVAPRLVERIQPRLEQFSIQNAPLAAALALCLGLSVAAERIGMAAIIGAFFAGLALADYAPRMQLQSSVHGIADLLGPFFFFMIGAQFDIHVFSSRVLVTAVFVSVLATFSKLVGGALPVLHEGWRVAIAVGIGMVPRGEVGLIVAAVGLQMNVISTSTYAIVVFMAAITTLVAPPFLRVVFPSEVEGRLSWTAPKVNFRAVVRALAGALVSSALATLAVYLFRNRTYSFDLPLWFIVVLLGITMIWGRVAGTVASVVGAMTFMFLLFAPIGNWAVSDKAARTNLGWMLLAGFVISYMTPLSATAVASHLSSQRSKPEGSA